MNLILSMPMEIRLAAVFLLGICLGSAVNWAVYGLAWRPRPIGPWTQPHPATPPRRGWDRLPVFGWIGLRRESTVHGAGFWVRPMFVELLLGLGLAWLYWWEVAALGLLPDGVVGPLPQGWQMVLHFEFAAHVMLITFMLAASLIDADETIIPDAITVPGTLAGLLLAAAQPWSQLPDAAARGLGGLTAGFLHMASPNSWPVTLNGFPKTASLVLGLACWWAWCAAILPFAWRPRHGWLRAVRLACARLRRHRGTRRILRMAAIGSLVILTAWYRGELVWMSLLSALVGMAVGGGLIWLVRILGSAALGREAMGFGDVTLMAMIGAFLGWQSCLIIFFLAPLAGLAVGLLRLILRREREIPYGPFLCMAALALILAWDKIWRETSHFFAMGWLVPSAMLICLALMAAMLIAWRLILGLFR